MSKAKPLACLSLLLSVAACAPQAPAGYNWGSYSNSMIAMDQDPAATSVYEQSLAKIVNGPSGSVPPGIYAEYGYMLQKRGDNGQAEAMYMREKSAWPVSAQFMDRMTASLQSQAAAQTQKPAS